MPTNRVTWNLRYPVNTPDELSRFRHHYETLTKDANVAEVEYAESATDPFLRHIRVMFKAGTERPDSVELRHLDQLYPSTASIERHIEMLANVTAGAGEALSTFGEMTRLAGISTVEMRRALETFRLPDRRIEASGFIMEPRTIPPWVKIGTVYRLKLSPRHLFTLMHVRGMPGEDDIMVDLIPDGGAPQCSRTMDEFVRFFEPYERGSRGLTAWDRLLADDED